MVNVIVIASIVACALWVYWDATGHRIGKIPGAGGAFNMSAGAWSIVTAMLWIVGFPSYLIQRSKLIERAREHPVEVGDRASKMVVLAIAGGLWVLVTLAGALFAPQR